MLLNTILSSAKSSDLVNSSLLTLIELRRQGRVVRLTKTSIESTTKHA